MSDLSSKLFQAQDNLKSVKQNEAQARKYLREINKHVKETLAGGTVYVTLDQFTLYDDWSSEGNSIYGFLSASKTGITLHLRSTETDEMEGEQPDEYRQYHPKKVSSWTIEMVRAVLSRDLVVKLVDKVDSVIASDAQQTALWVKNLETLATKPASVITAPLIKAAQQFRFTKVVKEWEDAYQLIAVDPGAAALRAGTLLETFLKHFLEVKTGSSHAGYTMSDLIKAIKQLLVNNSGLPLEPKIEKLLGDALILTQSVGSLRNEYSQAHGKAVSQRMASTEEARFGVTLAGAICVYLFSYM